MKEKAKILLLIAICMMLTGCLKMDYNMKITNDKKVSISIIYAINETLIKSIAPETDSKSSSSINMEEAQYLIDRGWNVEEYNKVINENTFAGVNISKTYSNINNISTPENREIIMSDLFDEEINFDESKYFSINDGIYKANFIFDFNDENEMSEETADESNANGYQNYFDLVYTVILPNKSISNNATSVSEDGKTLTWKMKYGEKNSVNFEFKYENNKPENGNITNSIKQIMNNDYFKLSIIGLEFLIIISLIIIIIKRK